MYGIDLWYDTNKCNNILKQFEVGHHKAIKKLFNVNYRSSNHIICEIAGLLTFRHFINKFQITFINRIFNKPCMFVLKNLYFLMNYSFLKYNVEKLLSKIYNIEDMFDNDIDAIKARILFVDRNEQSSCYGYTNLL